MKRTVKQDNSDFENNRLRLRSLFEKSLNILKTANGGIKLRSSILDKLNLNKDEIIRKLETRHTSFKDAVIKYHKSSIEKNKSEEYAFISALEKYNVDGSSFDEILDQQMDICKKQKIEDLNSKVTNNKENCYQYGNISLSGLSPILKTKGIDQSYKSYNFGALNQSGMTSPGSSINSSMINPKDCTVRFKLNHNLSQDVIFKKHCNTCCQQDSKTVMYKCIQCSGYIHYCCSKQRMCISLKKISVKITTERSLSLRILCGTLSLPMVPNIFLVIMYRIQSFGLSNAKIYTLECKEKEVKDLCQKLLDGELKYLIRSDVMIISGAFLMMLKSLREPLIPNGVINRLKSFINSNGSVIWDGIAKTLNELPIEFMHTLVYVLLHLKVVSSSAPCKLSSERLANIFTAVLVDSGTNDAATVQVITMLIDLDIIFYDKHFIIETDFFGPYFKELQCKELIT